jgi:hypothetical protein
MHHNLTKAALAKADERKAAVLRSVRRLEAEKADLIRIREACKALEHARTRALAIAHRLARYDAEAYAAWLSKH